eukprot:TRINITY_DN112584_c0_g1_i1.p1 TRINITY_DN112584_c0_g1~~TRINITY_DN112584_c0_g1_i1.p1  ORF type:complete len:211 (-),score=31.33 TRINITY_DN112584_c0_g1_i1:725-1357(-)
MSGFGFRSESFSSFEDDGFDTPKLRRLRTTDGEEVAALLAQVDGEATVGVPAALVCGFALTILSEELREPVAADIVHECPEADALHHWQCLAAGVAGCVAMISVVISWAVCFVGKRLACDVDTEVVKWWLQSTQPSRAFGRVCFIISWPFFLASVVLQPEAWCLNNDLAWHLALMFMGTFVMCVYFVLGPFPGFAGPDILIQRYSRIKQK